MQNYQTTKKTGLFNLRLPVWENAITWDAKELVEEDVGIKVVHNAVLIDIHEVGVKSKTLNFAQNKVVNDGGVAVIYYTVFVDIAKLRIVVLIRPRCANKGFIPIIIAVAVAIPIPGTGPGAGVPFLGSPPNFS